MPWKNLFEVPVAETTSHRYYRIQKNVPLPPPPPKRESFREIAERMEVGDSCLIPGFEHCEQANKNLGPKKFEWRYVESSNQINPIKDVRMWRVE